MNNKAESFRRFVMEIVKRIFVLLFAMLLCVLSSGTGYGAEQERKYIKWVDFLLSFSRILCVCRNTHPSLSLY